MASLLVELLLKGTSGGLSGIVQLPCLRCWDLDSPLLDHLLMVCVCVCVHAL